MSIIASIIIAASIADLFSGINFAPMEDTEYGGSQTNEISCITRSECKRLEEIERKVEILWTAHTNRLAKVEAHKAAVAEKRKSAIEQVRENAKKRRSRLGKASGGVK